MGRVWDKDSRLTGAGPVGPQSWVRSPCCALLRTNQPFHVHHQSTTFFLSTPSLRHQVRHPAAAVPPQTSCPTPPPRPRGFRGNIGLRGQKQLADFHRATCSGPLWPPSAPSTRGRSFTRRSGSESGNLQDSQVRSWKSFALLFLPKKISTQNLNETRSCGRRSS